MPYCGFGSRLLRIQKPSNLTEFLRFVFELIAHVPLVYPSDVSGR
ncbi:hypothetical protein SAMN05444354_101657 [Stigmatella aurantiaca]|uniref:Uncharacterized protein n=1 Tax=Stigmatella aurantiaca TaxID=41 RepID=A0A1H7HCM9_STIAU|nr:hypothetical protein SAMN05444354_101657 [Stigmatella aurantiaca]